VTDRSPTKPPLALPAHSHKQSVDGYRDDGCGEDPEEDEQLGYPYHRRAAVARLGRQDNKPVSVRTSRGHPVELPVEETSPPSSTSSDKPPVARQAGRSCEEEAEPNRAGSMLLQLIACGSATAGSAKCGGRAEPRRSCGLVSRLSSRAGAEDDDEEVVDIAGGELSRRLGQMRVDEEYFSGSIVESGGRGTPLPASSLKRSNSYNEER
jgi:hypothetical protein